MFLSVRPIAGTRRRRTARESVHSVLSVLTRNADFRRLFLAELIVFGADWFVMVPLLVLLNELTGKGPGAGWRWPSTPASSRCCCPTRAPSPTASTANLLMVIANLAALAAVASLFARARPGGRADRAGGDRPCWPWRKRSTPPAATAALPNLVDRQDLRDGHGRQRHRVGHHGHRRLVAGRRGQRAGSARTPASASSRSAWWPRRC